MNTEGTPSSENGIDQILAIPEYLQEIYISRRRNALVGSYSEIERKFNERPITDGWGAYSNALKRSGALVAVRHKTPMVNTDIIPKDLAPYVLEHEVVESTLDSDPSESHAEISAGILRRLDLMRHLSTMQIIVRLNHALAVVHQLRMAQRNGKLDEMMKFADELESRSENKAQAVGNKEFRDAVATMLKTKYPADQ